MNIRLFGRLAVIVFFLSLFLIYMVALRLFSRAIIDHSFADILPDDGDMYFIEVQKECKNSLVQRGNVTARCCVVVDIIDRKRKDLVRRAMYFDNVRDAFESEVMLIRPKGMTVDNSDTRLWSINHNHILNEYIAAMVLMPFLVGSLTTSPPEQTSSGSTLLVGLGGGSLDMFLHSNFPWLNITVYELDAVVIKLAEQWFDVLNDHKRRTFAGNGLVAIQKHIARGDRFDMIFVDACDSSNTRISCPDAVFLTVDAIQNFKHALKPLGVFVLNVLPVEEREEEKAIEHVQRKLLLVFPLCVRMRMSKQLNSVFACLPYTFDPGDLDSILHLWQQRKDQLAEKLGFRQLLEGVRLSSRQQKRAN